MALIQCTKPKDISPIISAITQRISEIKAISPNAKIAIWAGELHTHPAHKLIQPALLESLTNNGLSCVYAFEKACNYATSAANDHRITIPNDFIDKWSQYDPNHHMLGKMFMTSHGQRMAPRTIEAILEYCVSHDVEIAFTDAARFMGLNSLDLSEPTTGAVAKSLGIPSSMDINISTPQGMALRNHVMVEKVTHLLKKADVVIQHCGAAHVLGDKKRKFHYEDSLKGIFTQRHGSNEDYFSISIVPQPPSFETPVPHENPDTFLIEGLDEGSYGADSDEIISEVDYISSLQGVPDFFKNYSKRSACKSSISIETYRFLEQIVEREQKLGNHSVRNRRPMIF